MLSVLRQQKDEEENHNSQQHSGNERGQASATAELLRLKDHLIDVEKNVRFRLTSQSVSQYHAPVCCC